jgi:hypothetical protein
VPAAEVEGRDWALARVGFVSLSTDHAVTLDGGIL